MILRAAALALLLTASAVRAETVAEQAAAASASLAEAVQALETATKARDRVAALTQTIRAYEEGLAALREALRQAELRETTLTLSFNAKRDQIGQLLGVLARMEAEPGPLLLLHPDGPLGTARSGMILAEVTPALQAEADQLKAELAELAHLRALQAAAGKTLAEGLTAAQEARAALSQAISDRTDLPKRFTEDPEVLKVLLESADTLEAFAGGLGVTDDPDGGSSFATAKARLPLPVFGAILRRPGETDAAGVRRPGLTLATRPRALVTAPWPSTIRYLGPLLDYGNVIVLEPGDGYLLVLAGLDSLYGEVGEVIPAGAPLGLMGGGTDDTGDDAGEGTEFTAGGQDGSGAQGTETLYLELRQGAEPVDPMPWFAATAATGD